MHKHCEGHRRAMKRKDILDHLPIEIKDRTFRRIISELKHENEIASHHSKGYWAIPLYTTDRSEVEWVKRSWSDMHSKALNMLRDCERQIRELDARLQARQDLFDKVDII
jgi:hypothetical protein